MCWCIATNVTYKQKIELYSIVNELKIETIATKNNIFTHFFINW